MKSRQEKTIVMKKILFLLAVLGVSQSYAQQTVHLQEEESKKEVLILANENTQTTTEDPVCVTSQGGYAKLLKGSLNLYNPGLSWKVTECSTSKTSYKYETLVLDMIASDTYFKFNDESRILMRFSDGTVATLHRRKGDQTMEKYDNCVLDGTIFHLYHAVTEYDLDSASRAALLNPAIEIVKIRVVLTNGNVRDFDMSGKVGRKFLEAIRSSYLAALKSNHVRINNSDDSNF